MEKVYAIVRPSTYFTPGAAALGDMFVDLYHQYKYPSYAGYSLGHEPLFFDTLDDAKNYLFPIERRAEWGWLERRRGHDAILELDVEDSEVKDIASLSTFRGFRDLNSPSWATETKPDEIITPDVLQSMSDALKVRYVKPHELDRKSTHPKAKLCRQASAMFDQYNGAPEKDFHPTTGEAITAMGSGMVGGLSLFSLLLAPDGLPVTALLAGLAVLLERSATSRSRSIEAEETNKRNFIRHTLFAADHAGEAAPSEIGVTNVNRI